MIDKSTALEDLLRRLGKLPTGHCLEVRSYKRDRALLLRRRGVDAYEIREDGFFAERHVCDGKGLRRLLRTLLKREFPRSAKLRLSQLGACDPDAPRALKTI